MEKPSIEKFEQMSQASLRFFSQVWNENTKEGVEIMV